MARTVSNKRAKTEQEEIPSEPSKVVEIVKAPIAEQQQPVMDSSDEKEEPKPTNKYNECKKVAKVALSILSDFSIKSYSDLTQLLSSDKSKAEKELVAMVVLLQQRAPHATQYSMDAILKMKVGTLRKTAKSLLE